MKKNTRKARPPKKTTFVQAKAISPPRNLTPELCDRLRRDMMKACIAVAEINGLTVEGGELSDIDLRHSFEIGFRVGIPQEDGAIYSPDKAMFEVLAPHFGLEPSDHGRTFRSFEARRTLEKSEGSTPGALARNGRPDYQSQTRRPSL